MKKAKAAVLKYTLLDQLSSQPRTGQQLPERAQPLASSGPPLPQCDGECFDHLLSPSRQDGNDIHGVLAFMDQQRIRASANRGRDIPQSIYAPLKPWQTRLLELRKGKGYGSMIPRCRLHNVEFIDMEGVGISGTARIVTYTALSYSWGHGNLDCFIECDGVNLPISRALAVALVRLGNANLQTTDDVLYLWCDAICINQSDKAEKAAQVRNILRIFEKAERVIAWLGEPEDNVTNMLDGPWHLRKNRGKGALFDRGWQMLSEPKRYHQDICLETLRDLKSAVEALCQSAWFRRTWVRQEVFAARDITITYGTCSISYPEFFHAAERWSKVGADSKGIIHERIKEPDPDGFSPAFTQLYKHLQHSGTDRFDYRPPQTLRRHTYHWLRTLQDGTDFDVSDERDRVYGVLGIIQSRTTRFFVEDSEEIRNSTFPISYEKTVSAVFQDVVKYLINVDRNLDVLTVFEDRRGRASDLPSWVPDWRHRTARSFITLPPDKERDVPGIYGPPQWQELSALNKLTLEGISPWMPVDRIETMTRSFADAYLSKEFLDSSYPVGAWLNENILDILNGGGYAMSTLRLKAWVNPDLIESGNLCVPVKTMLGDIAVSLEGSRCLHILRPLPKYEYTMVGSAILLQARRQMTLARGGGDLFSLWDQVDAAWSRGTPTVEQYTIV